MIEFEVDIVTNDGEMNTFITHPEEGSPFAVILFLMDAPGKRGELHDMARRLATDGYYVLLPNLYYRRTRDFAMDNSDAARKIMFEHMDSLSNKMVVEDCRALLEYAHASDATKNVTKKGPVGVVGYCMSGPFAFAVAGQLSNTSATNMGPTPLSPGPSPKTILNRIINNRNGRAITKSANRIIRLSVRPPV